MSDDTRTSTTLELTTSQFCETAPTLHELLAKLFGHFQALNDKRAGFHCTNMEAYHREKSSSAEEVFACKWLQTTRTRLLR